MNIDLLESGNSLINDEIQQLWLHITMFNHYLSISSQHETWSASIFDEALSSYCDWSAQMMSSAYIMSVVIKRNKVSLNGKKLLKSICLQNFMMIVTGKLV